MDGNLITDLAASVAPISLNIWDMKYRFVAPDGEQSDASFEDTWRRVARALASVETDPAHWEEVFYGALKDFQFLPAGRIVAGAGTERSVTLFNCFVMGTIPDTMGGIFDQLREAALTMQQGGGIGYDFSTLRPKGALVKGVGADASGPLSFMEVWDAMCRTIMSAGYRRGAMMATLRCDHPDIEAFIDAKREPGRLRMFNLSVLVTDAFMAAVKADGPWDLSFEGKVFRTIQARALWDRIMRATYDYAEPGVIFIDQINRRNNLAYCESIAATNPCFAEGTPVMVRRDGTVERAEISTLEGKTEQIWTGTKWQRTEFRVTGENVPVKKLTLSNGHSLRPTHYHKWIKADGSRVMTKELVPGDQLRCAIEIGVPLSVVDVCDDGVADKVYCCTVKGEHSFTIFAGDDAIVTGQCGEQPLPPYGACLLGSINLATLVKKPFEADAMLDLDRMSDLVVTAVRMMDNVIDVSKFPLFQQEAEARGKRRIGLGVTGLADALIMCRLRYGSPEAVAAADRWMAAIRRVAYGASIELAREKGEFPMMDRAAYLAGVTIQELDADIRAGIQEHGIRNALLTSIAPTGTISLMADNVSSGLEPVFSYRYSRKVLMRDGTKQDFVVSDYAYRLFRKLKGEDEPLPDYFVDAQTLAPIDHVVMQAVAQKYIDSSISKTINLPADIPFADFQQVYEEAYVRGCKGCTTYRPNEITGSVLTVDATETATPAAETSPLVADAPLPRPQDLPGRTYKLRWPESDHAIYITINDVVHDGRRQPFEIFINSKNMDNFAWTVGLTRMISAVFRRGGDVSFVVEELRAVFDPRGGAWMDGRYVPSLLAAIGDVLAEHLVKIGFTSEPTALGADLAVADAPATALKGDRCPKCSHQTLVRAEGCAECHTCGFSKCG